MNEILKPTLTFRRHIPNYAIESARFNGSHHNIVMGPTKRRCRICRKNVRPLFTKYDTALHVQCRVEYHAMKSLYKTFNAYVCYVNVIYPICIITMFIIPMKINIYIYIYSNLDRFYKTILLLFIGIIRFYWQNDEKYIATENLPIIDPALCPLRRAAYNLIRKWNQYFVTTKLSES